MRLERSKRELMKTYRKQTKAGVLTDCLLIDAVKMATIEGKGLAADIVVGYAKWIQQRQIARIKQGADHAGQHQTEQGGTAPAEVQGVNEVHGRGGAATGRQRAAGNDNGQAQGPQGDQEHQEGRRR